MKPLLLLLLLGLAAAPAAAAPPRRIVSLNLCADQLLLALADPPQIAALSPLARDRSLSAEAARAARFPVGRAGAEDVLALAPDLILSSPISGFGTTAALREQGYRMIELPAAESYGEIVRQIRLVARAVGHPDRGEAMIGQMDAALAALPRTAGTPVAAYYQRRGYLSGAGTLVDEIMRRVGLRNLASELGKNPLARLTVEQMVAADPDFLIVERSTDRVRDQGSEMLHHPALARIPRLRLPASWTVCGGRAYAWAARSLADQLRAASR